MARLKHFVLSAMIVITAGCSSENSDHQEAASDAGVFQGYKDNLDKAKSVDQTLMQADKARRTMIDKNN